MSQRRPRTAVRVLLAALLQASLISSAGAPVVSAQVPLAPLRADQVSHRLTREVFGYLPYWELNSGIDAYLRYDLLSTIAFFGVGIKADGSLDTTTSGYKAYMSDLATQIIDKAHAAGIRTVITFQSFGTTKNAAFFSNAAAQATFVNQAVALMAVRGADGANLDVEGLAGTYFPAYGALTGALRSAAMAVNPIATISVATNGNTSGAKMAAVAIANGADRAFLMGYSYRTSGSNPVGSIDPLVRAGGGLSLSTSLDLYASYGVPLDRVLLGIAYYGRSWPTVSADLRAARQTNTSLYGSSVVFYPRTLPASAAGATFDYDPVEQSARLTKFDVSRNTWVQTYYNDGLTMAAKIGLTNQRNLAGMGIWALGYDRGQPGYWDAVAAAYAAPKITSVTVMPAMPPPNTIPTPGLTNSPNVLVNTAWQDGGAPTTEIQFSNDGLTWSGWQPIAPSLPWALTQGAPDGPQVAYVQVRGMNGAVSQTAMAAVVVDTTGPIANPPSAAIPVRSTAGTTGPGDVPVKIAWNGADATSGVASYLLEASLDGAPYAPQTLPSPAGTTVVMTLSTSHTYRFRVTATDRAGNVGLPAEGAPVSIAIVQESASAVRYSAGWRKVSSSNALGGTLKYSTLSGSTATFRFTGSAISLVGPLGPTRGVAKVLIDGVAAGAFNEYAKVGRSRQVVYSRTVAPGAHTITIKLVGTAGHPRVDLDAFVVLK